MLINESQYQILSYPEVKNKYPDIFYKKDSYTRLRGMTFCKNKPYSFFIMSDNSSYNDNVEKDCIEYDGTNIIGDKEGLENQISKNKNGFLNINGIFIKEIESYKKSLRDLVVVKILRKIITNKWVDYGFFKINDFQYLFDGKRNKYVFYCYPVKYDDNNSNWNKIEHNRRIPGEIMTKVFDRDRGRCVVCKTTTNIQFDHILPFSKGGTSLDENNIQLLCIKCNYKKGDNINYP